MATKQQERKSIGVRRASYAGTIVVNAILIWVFGRLLVWDWPDFLTGEFTEVLPWIRFSLTMGIVVAVARFVKDPRWFVSLTECVNAIVTLVVAARILRVFPFDFTGKPSFWEPVARVALILSIVATAVAVVVNLVWAIIYALRESPTSPMEEFPSPAL